MAEKVAGALRQSWSGKAAFVLAAAASAVGLGNMWRFPYLAAKYGGGAFLLTYIVLVFTVGISLLILEISLGRHTQKSDIGAFSHFGKKFTIIGILASAVPFIITPYYGIIGGWVTKYLVSYATMSTSDIAADGFFGAFITSPVASFIFMAIFMAITLLVVWFGVKNGIEKANLVMMPILLLFVAGLAIYTLTQPGAIDGVIYYLKPDFSKFSPDLFIAALGQMFFSMSLAMGIMITYGSYLSKKENIVSSAAQVGGFDLGVSFLAGLMIVPLAFVALGSGDAVAETAGPGLMFVVLPGLFETFGSLGNAIGVIFFILVLFAALTSMISLTETCVSIIQDGTGASRAKSFGITAAIVVIAGIIINMGYNVLIFLEPLGEGTQLLDLADFISNSVLMPIVAFLTAVFVGWVIKPAKLIEEVESEGNAFPLKNVWAFMVKFIIPIVTLVILVAYVGAQFGLISF
ncbi:MAG: sodium-dependent transporter [Eggerthellaceae bacterium]|nr:sodium-dependent transporter [Eggerthellaceae bacterium]